LDYNQTLFIGGATGGANRPEEKVLFSRMQIAF
jgi:phosphate-selective porin OprO/OprP